MNSYYLNLARTMDRCCAHIVALGDPQIVQVADDDLTSVIGCAPHDIDHHCVFFWDLPNYVFLPKDSMAEWCSAIGTLRMFRERKWLSDNMREYTDDLDLSTKFSNLLNELGNPFHCFRTQDPLQRKRDEKRFDVFLCYNGKDKSQVKRIAQMLEEHAILPWMDDWEVPPGKTFQELIEEQIVQIQSAAIFIGPSGISSWQRKELRAFLAESNTRKVDIIPVILGNVREEPKLPPFLREYTRVDFRKSDSNALRELIWGITGKRERKVGGDVPR